MSSKKIDTRGTGLDIALGLMKWLTGAENLHYGYWEGLDVCAGNVGPAQVAYTDRLFKLLKPEPSRILDIGGGAGETARKLIALGHSVEIVVPSAFLAERCRENAPEAIVHEAKFEEADLEGQFDVCLFSESYQYIPLNQGLAICERLLAPRGRVIVSDCFRSAAHVHDPVNATVGGGHPIADFVDLVQASPFRITHEEDITAHAAPSVDVEQGLFNAVGYGVQRFDAELSAKKPRLRSVGFWIFKRLMKKRARKRLDARLNGQDRNAANFVRYNRYLMMRLERG